MEKASLRFGILTLAALAAACGGGGYDEPPEPATDVFDAVASESAALSGLRFAHQYSIVESTGTDESTGFDCPDYPALDEAALRAQASSSTDYRVCFANGGTQVCEYPGVQALRESQDSSTARTETVALRTADDNDSAIFVISQADDGEPPFELVGIMATERDASCNENAPPAYAFDDIEGSWSVRAYGIDGHGTPMLAASGTFACAGTSCTGPSGISVTNLVESTAPGDGLAYAGRVTVAGATYVDARTVLSKNKRTLATLACPDGVATSALLTSCRYLIAARQ